MNNAIKFKTLKSENGVSLILTFFIMVIILIIVLSISIILYSEVKVIRNIGNSIISLYAADSGIEKVLYYDRQVRPTVSTGKICNHTSPCPSGQTCPCPSGQTCPCPSGQTCDPGTDFCTIAAPRGLCSMLDSNNHYYCARPDNSSDQSIFCDNPILPVLTGGCDPTTCNKCQIYFSTTFDNRTYATTAIVSPDADTLKKDPDYTITSKGFYGGTQREIEILIKPIQ